MATTSQRPSAPGRVLQGDAGDTVDGTEGNERLTAATGAALIVTLAALGVTIINLRLLIWEHLFIGLLVIPPVALKLATTGYRFVRYYARNAVYVRKGPPPLLLRATAPVLVVTTLLVLVSGVVLLFVGPKDRGTYFPIHKVSFIVWAGFFALHVLGHLPSLPKALRGDYAPQSDLSGRSGRVITLVGAIVAGLVLAVVLIPDFATWTSSHVWLHRHHHEG